MTDQRRDNPQFYLTKASPCPYLPGMEERKVFTHLTGEIAPALNDILTQGGFRRSQNIAYRPACEQCRACTSTRVVVKDFALTRSWKRVLQANRDVSVTEKPAHPSAEQYSIFRAYLDSRHADGGMTTMSVLDYAMMVEDTHVNTRVFEYRAGGKLIACSLTDILSDGASMIYSFYEPEEPSSRSLGTFMILDHILRAKELGKKHVYLGYWVKGSAKMEYKMRFGPQEHLGGSGWERHIRGLNTAPPVSGCATPVVPG